MTSKHEAESDQSFDIESASWKWLKKYLNIPHNGLRLLALDYAIKSIRIEGIRSQLQNRGVTSNKSWSNLRSLEANNEKEITKLSEKYGKESRFLRLYSASFFIMEHFASNLEKDNQMPRAVAFRNVGVIIRRQKDIVLANHRGSAFNPDLG